uniref:Ketimine reductase mu-crystallin n=1 Tax=Cuerna arida TaxID=1464854 RepID=A0A1B6FE91_9HEMI
MPAFCGKEHAFGCKVISFFPKNSEKGLPSINGIVILLDSETGRLKMILDANEITAWRTAAVSTVATKYMHKGEKKVLAILGAGVQGRSHALALYHFFKFSQVRIWNRTYERAKALCAELGHWAVPFENAEMCVRGADVIVTATFSMEPIVEAEWLKTGAHINAVGGMLMQYEPALDVYKHATIVVELLENKQELQGIYAMGVEPFCELGDLTRGTRKLPDTNQFSIFQSLGMGIEDIATAEVIYNQFMKNK